MTLPNDLRRFFATQAPDGKRDRAIDALPSLTARATLISLLQPYADPARNRQAHRRQIATSLIDRLNQGEN